MMTADTQCTVVDMKIEYNHCLFFLMCDKGYDVCCQNDSTDWVS